MFTAARLLCALATTAAFVAAPAQPSSAAAQAGAAAAPQVRFHGGVAYVTTGADDAARADAMRVGHDMNLQLTFVRAPHGEPLSDVAVEIIDRHGQTVLALASAESSLLARLVPGAYRITARVHGQMLQRQIEVPRQGRHVENLVWRDSAPIRLLERP